ncbi:MAG: hypothetical protein Q9162_006202 [Coniocarpon cinnabarinum]
MSIREAVFVEEQKVPIENEYDADDRRSHHWVTYASVSRPTNRGSVASSGDLEPLDSSRKPSKEEERRRSQPTSTKLAVGTVRLVPPPHAPHPAPNSHHKIDNAEAASPDRPTETTAPAAALAKSHEKPYEVPGFGIIDPKEPYLKLGRLAILQPYRRLGMGRMLLEAALEFAGQHPADVMPPPPTGAERERQAEHYRNNSDPTMGSPVALALSNTHDIDDWALGSGEPVYDGGPWKGLVLVHAQKHLEKTYAKWGFVRDDALGVWDEEGIDHIGMWRRVFVVDQRG